MAYEDSLISHPISQRIPKDYIEHTSGSFGAYVVSTIAIGA